MGIFGWMRRRADGRQESKKRDGRRGEGRDDEGAWLPAYMPLAPDVTDVQAARVEAAHGEAPQADVPQADAPQIDAPDDFDLPSFD